jgi:hypothetical protein
MQTSSVPEHDVFAVVVRNFGIRVRGGRKHDDMANILAHLRGDETEPVSGMVGGVIGGFVVAHCPWVRALHVGHTSQPLILLALSGGGGTYVVVQDIEHLDLRSVPTTLREELLLARIVDLAVVPPVQLASDAFQYAAEDIAHVCDWGLDDLIVGSGNWRPGDSDIRSSGDGGTKRRGKRDELDDDHGER